MQNDTFYASACKDACGIFGTNGTIPMLFVLIVSFKDAICQKTVGKRQMTAHIVEKTDTFC